MSVRLRILALLFGIFGFLLTALWNGQQGPRPLLAAEPTRVQPTALPWPTHTPVPQVIRVPVATILLTVSESDTPLNSVVQWQDDMGGWHEVEGWRGTVGGNRTVWWVEAKDWGKGPFRWLVYESGTEADSILAVSGEFYLPSRQGEVTRISVQVP